MFLFCFVKEKGKNKSDFEVVWALVSIQPLLLSRVSDETLRASVSCLSRRARSPVG